MKKTRLLAALLAAGMMLSLAACGGSASSSAASSGAAASSAASSAAASSAAETADFTTVNDGVLTMATNAQFPPYEYYEGETIVGIDTEIVAAIAEKLGLDYKIEDMEFDSIITAIQTGKADIGLAGITVTDERKEAVNFTESYATGKQVIIVTEDSAITSVDDLFAEGASHIIGVQRNTTGDLYTTWDLEDAGLATIDRYSKGAEAVQALKTGKVDCVVIDNEPAKAFVAEVDGLKILETEYIEEQYAAAMNKDNEALYEAVNGALKELIADGTVQSIIDKYISAE